MKPTRCSAKVRSLTVALDGSGRVYCSAKAPRVASSSPVGRKKSKFWAFIPGPYLRSPGLLHRPAKVMAMDLLEMVFKRKVIPHRQFEQVDGRLAGDFRDRVVEIGPLDLLAVGHHGGLDQGVEELPDVSGPGI